MRAPVRNAAVVLGIWVAGYGTASLTGGWLGTPPWWERATPMSATDWLGKYYAAEWVPEIPYEVQPEDVGIPSLIGGGSPAHYGVTWERTVELERLAAERGPLHTDPRIGRVGVSVGVLSMGLALAAFGAWPRRRSRVM